MKSYLKIILLSVALIIGIQLTFLIVDYNRLSDGKAPIFMMSEVSEFENKITYWGFGYKALRYTSNELEEDEIKFGFWFKTWKISCNNCTSFEDEEFIIVDETDMCAEMIEMFYEDELYRYSFNCMRSATTFIKFKDGIRYTIKEAVNSGIIDINKILNKISSTNRIIYREPKFSIKVSPSDKKEKEVIMSKFMSSVTVPLENNIYKYGLDKIEIIIDEEIYDFREVVDTKRLITMGDIINDLEYKSIYGEVSKETYKDGGSVIYNASEYSLLKCNTINGNRDIIIGNSGELNSDFCSNED